MCRVCRDHTALTLSSLRSMSLPPPPYGGVVSYGSGAVWLLRDLKTMLMLVPGPAKLCMAAELHL